MKLSRLRGLFALLLVAVPAQPQAQKGSVAQAPAAEQAGDRETVHKFSLQIEKLNPDVSTAALERNNNLYVQALPSVRKALVDKSCAGRACAPMVVDRALFDTYLFTMQRKDYGIIGINDVGQTVRDTSDIYVWSSPANADFKLLLGTVTAWAEKTNKDRFVPKSDYILHIELPGYAPFDGPCSNKKDEGVFCGATLKKN